MSGRRAALAFVVVLLALAAATVAAVRSARRGAVNPWASDSADAAALRAGGAHAEAEHVVLWYPRGALARPRPGELADSISRGIAAMERLVGAPYPWQRLAGRKVAVWLAPHRFIAHGTGKGDVFVPLDRALDGTAPYLHEAAHELLLPTVAFRSGDESNPFAIARLLDVAPPWLYEGLADAVSRDDAVRNAPGAVRYRDVFAVGTPATNDSVCAARLHSDAGRDVLDAVGTTGRGAVLASLYSEERRPTVAPAFYACADSFTRFVASRAGGLAALAARIPQMQRDGLEATVRSATGAPLDSLRAEWMRRLAVDSLRAR